MIGSLLVIFSILLYIKGNKKASILLFICFSYRGFAVLTDNIMGLKNQDAALIYFIVILTYSFWTEKTKQYIKNRNLERILFLFFVFMLFNIFFSAIYYNLDTYQIIQGSRRFFIIFAYFFMRKMELKDVEWIFKALIYISVFTGILYIIQCLTGLPTLPESELALSTDSVDGTLRYYNYPPCVEVALILLILNPKLIKGKLKYCFLIILSIAVILSQGRTLLLGILLAVTFGIYQMNGFKSIAKYCVVFVVLAIPFSPLLNERFSESNGRGILSEIEAIQSGDFVMGDGGTLTFRLALVYERMNYINNASIGEKIFGLGLLSDQQKVLVDKMYDFQIGLVDRQTKEVYQLSTPDIAYGNLICKLGYVGTIIYMMIFFMICIQAYKYRNKNINILCLFCMLISYFVTSFASSLLSYSESFSLIYLFLGSLNNEINKQRIAIARQND